MSRTSCVRLCHDQLLPCRLITGCSCSSKAAQSRQCVRVARKFRLLLRNCVRRLIRMKKGMPMREAYRKAGLKPEEMDWEAMGMDVRTCGKELAIRPSKWVAV